MALESDFDGNELYRDWLICQRQEHWEGYNPLSNYCHIARSLVALKAKIDRIELELR